MVQSNPIFIGDFWEWQKVFDLIQFKITIGGPVFHSIQFEMKRNYSHSTTCD